MHLLSQTSHLGVEVVFSDLQPTTVSVLRVCFRRRFRCGETNLEESRHPVCVNIGVMIQGAKHFLFLTRFGLWSSGEDLFAPDWEPAQQVAPTPRVTALSLQ